MGREVLTFVLDVDARSFALLDSFFLYSESSCNIAVCQRDYRKVSN